MIPRTNDDDTIKETNILESRRPRVVPPPSLFENQDGGMVEITLDGEYRDDWRADEVSKRRLKSMYGPGEYECRWVPPKGSKAEPVTKRFRIKQEHDGSSGAGMGRVEAAIRQLEVMQAKHRERVDAEWMKVLETQREMANNNLVGVANVMQQANAQSMQLFQQMREADRERDERLRKENNDSAERERTRIEAHNRMMLETMQARISAEAPKDPLEQIQTVTALVEALEKINPKEAADWKSQLIQAAPELLSGLANGYGSVAESADKLRRAKEVEALLAAGQLPAPVPAALPQQQAAPAALPAPAVPPLQVPEQLTAEDVELALAIQFVEFLDHLHESSWDGMLRSTMQSGTMPSKLVEPVQQLYAGNPGPIVAFLKSIDADDMIPRAAEVIRAIRAEGQDQQQPVGAAGDWLSRVELGAPGLDGATGPGPHGGAPGPDHQGEPGSAGAGLGTPDPS